MDKSFIKKILRYDPKLICSHLQLVSGLSLNISSGITTMQNKGFSILMFIVICSLTVLQAGCDNPPEKKDARAVGLSIISGSENKNLEPLIQDFARKNNVQITMNYKGSVDMKLMLNQKANFPYDAVWPANSLWIELGDTGHLVGHVQSIMKSPVVFACKRSKAEELGWTQGKVRMEQIMESAKAGLLRFAMTSATQSNSGACTYLGMLNAMVGNPSSAMSLKDLEKTELQERVKQFLALVNRSSGSSGWLKDFFQNNYDLLDGMFNYEAMIIEFNQWAAKHNREPLYVIYPSDGIVVADHPLGYVDKKNPEKEKLFLELQAYLKSPEVQQSIQESGRRTGLVGLALEHPDLKVFNPAWGIDATREISSFPLPNRDTIALALDLYQGVLRKKSLTIYVLDFSGSMKGAGYHQLVSAMSTLLDYNTAKQFMIQPTPGDMHIVIPFNGAVIDEWTAKGDSPQVLQDLLTKIKNLTPDDGTNMYLALVRAIEILAQHKGELNDFSPAIMLMTDGASDGTIDSLQEVLERTGLMRVIPIYSIAFGNAKPEQLQAISTMTAGRYFDGRLGDLSSKFRVMKGYN